ncbi:anti-sigma factor [Nonomuraea roseoviolacea subsp. roseoviolacea]|uniref:anti-sigma factor n=1 Tax=Nonomuraea roseoviolacea TaxID=103837 RepID=UPI0031D985A3
MTEELHALSGAYAVHALPEAEAVLFERHLAGCAACAAEVRRLRETAARLALPLAEPPPARLWPRVLSAARLLRARRPVPHRRGRRGRRQGAATVALAAVSVAAAVVAVVLGMAARDARGDLDAARAREREVAAVLAAPDARTVRRPVASGGMGTLVVSRARGSVVFASAGLPRLPASRVYELWLTGPGGARPAALLDPGPGGGPVPIRVREGDARLGLTVEPAGGSERPTTRPLLLADLPPA